MEKIEAALRDASVFVAIGTSGLVYPAAGFVNWVKPDCRRVLLNKDEAQNNPFFDEIYLGPATQVVPRFFEISSGAHTPPEI